MAMTQEYYCPICLDCMTAADAAHPLQCTSMCGYNFCLTCIESLITSSKDDYGEASDGNMHVKVFLHCPNCRSDLGPTIRDTVLLRKADHIIACKGGSDEDLSASELRMKGVMDDEEVKTAIAEARKREAEFFGKKYQEEDQEEVGTAEEDADEEIIEEMGVEADLLIGVHQSMRMPKPPPPRNNNSPRSGKDRVDGTLLGGLESAMSQAEAQQITDLMTSGDAAKLASAAEILHGITEMARKGLTPAQRSGPGTQRRGGRNSTRSSVYMLIEESRQVREASKQHAAAKEQGKVANRLAAAGGGAVAGTRPTRRQARQGIVNAAQHREAEINLRRQMEFMKKFPLPVRMPKYVEVTLHDPSSRKFALGFCDDTWDGTVLDAYSKITVGGGGVRQPQVKRKVPKNHGGVFRILNMDAADDSYNNPRLDTDKPRVLVSSVRSEGGRQGIVKGDVVTHVDGEEFAGSAEDLRGLIRASLGRNDGTAVLRLVLNAERSTADALRRRAAVMD